MQNLQLGDPRESNTDMGPQADSKQAAAVARFLEARTQDGEALVGVMVLHEFGDEAGAVKRANDSEYGLYASVFTKDVGKALPVARALEAGNVGANCTSPDGAYELRFGGWKMSGIRYQKGSSAILEWTQGKSFLINHSI